MTNKEIRITEEAYNILINAKRPEEILSEYILRKYGKKANRSN